jgi:hypothetical protein
VHVDVRTGMPARQFPAAGGGKRQRDHVLVAGDDPAVGHDQWKLTVDVG